MPAGVGRGSLYGPLFSCRTSVYSTVACAAELGSFTAKKGVCDEPGIMDHDGTLHSVSCVRWLSERQDPRQHAEGISALRRLETLENSSVDDCTSASDLYGSCRIAEAECAVGKTMDFFHRERLPLFVFDSNLFLAC